MCFNLSCVQFPVSICIVYVYVQHYNVVKHLLSKRVIAFSAGVMHDNGHPKYSSWSTDCCLLKCLNHVGVLAGLKLYLAFEEFVSTNYDLLTLKLGINSLLLIPHFCDIQAIKTWHNIKAKTQECMSILA